MTNEELTQYIIDYVRDRDRMFISHSYSIQKQFEQDTFNHILEKIRENCWDDENMMYFLGNNSHLSMREIEYKLKVLKIARAK
jgi:hypothetical protein